MGYRFILASGSPRRRELLSDAGFEFEVISPKVSERTTPSLTLREITLANALLKGVAVGRAHPADVVLAADTLVALDGVIIGKPKHLEDAREILRRLSGRTHEVCSAVYVGQRARKRERVFYVISRVSFRELTEASITAYFAKIDPMDKAGAYAAQGQGREIIKKIDASYTNVVGLPMEQTIRALRAFGVRPRSGQRTSTASRSASSTG